MEYLDGILGIIGTIVAMLIPIKAILFLLPGEWVTRYRILMIAIETVEKVINAMVSNLKKAAETKGGTSSERN